MKNLFITILTFCTLTTGSSIAQTCSVNVTLDSQQAVDEFPSNYPDCTRIEGEVAISGASITNIDSLGYITYIESLYVSGTSLTDITLNNLDTIGFSLSIGNNESLGNIQINNLKYTLGLDIFESVSLTNITFNSLDVIEASLLINDTSVESINMNSLTSVGGPLFLLDNHNLTNLGFNSLTTAGALNISLNGSLTNLEGLNNLESAGGLALAFNSELMDISALSNLTDIQGALTIGISQLTSLTGLENINHNGITELDISGNFDLSVCSVESICNYLAQGGEATIEYNAEGCNTVSEILEGCGTTSVYTAEASISVNVFPNPFDEYTRFEVQGETVKELHLNLYDMMGCEVLQQQPTHQQHITLYKNKLPPGVYTFRLMDEKHQLATGKLVIK